MENKNTYIFEIPYINLLYKPTRWRTFIAAVIPSWAVGIILLGVAFKWVPNWRYLCYTNVVLGCLPLITFWFCPESLRWLLTQGRIEDAKHTLTILTRRNKRPPPDFAALDTLVILIWWNLFGFVMRKVDVFPEDMIIDILIWWNLSFQKKW